MTGLSFCWPVAYDWRRAIPAIVDRWNDGDEHLVAWDRRGLTWAGGVFAPPGVQEIRGSLEAAGVPYSAQLDRLRFFPGDYYWPGQHRQHVQTAERNALTYLCRRGNLIVMPDADERWCNPAEAAAWLQSWRARWTRDGQPVGFLQDMRTVIKVIKGTALVVAAEQVFAVSQPGIFEFSRALTAVVTTPLRTVNWSFGADDDGTMATKLAAVLYTEGYRPAELIELWHALTLENYHGFRSWGGLALDLRPMDVGDLAAGRWEHR